MKQLLYLLYFLLPVFCFSQDQDPCNKKVEKLYVYGNVQNKKEKKVFRVDYNAENYADKDNHAYECLYKTKSDCTYTVFEFENYFNVGFKKVRTTRNTYDSLYKAGFNAELRSEEIREKCEWKMTCMEVDSTVLIDREYCGPYDSVKLFKARIRIDFYYKARKKHQQLFFTGYIPVHDGPQFVSSFNSRDLENYFGVESVVCYPDCDIYELVINYSRFNYKCDVTSPEMYFYF